MKKNEINGSPKNDILLNATLGSATYTTKPKEPDLLPLLKIQLTP